MNLKKIGQVFTSKSVGTGRSYNEKRIYRAAVSQRLRNTGLDALGGGDKIETGLWKRKMLTLRSESSLQECRILREVDHATSVNL